VRKASISTLAFWDFIVTVTELLMLLSILGFQHFTGWVMGAVAVNPGCHIAVVAKQLVTRREIMLDEPRVKAVTTLGPNTFPVFISFAIYVVKGHENDIILSTASTLNHPTLSVFSQDCQFRCPFTFPLIDIFWVSREGFQVDRGFLITPSFIDGVSINKPLLGPVLVSVG
jgi:hypothetical protein